MTPDHRDLLRNIKTFPSLVRYLRDELDWPIGKESFEDLTFEYSPDELGIDERNAAKIEEIKRLRPLSVSQPWGIFFVKFEPKRLPVVALRRILNQVVRKNRTSGDRAERAAWAMDDLLFISDYGEGEERKISLAHFSQDGERGTLPALKVLGWDDLDTALHLDHVADELTSKLRWPDDEEAVDVWRDLWRSAFTLEHREVITTSKKLAEELARLARAIRNRVLTVLEMEPDSGPVTEMMEAFREALVHDLTEDSFADMYAQTVAYGLLSARITNPEGGTSELPVTNPFLKELLEEFLRVGRDDPGIASDSAIDFDELGVGDVVDLLDRANMEAVVRDFGDQNPEEDPVIHFYEHFLAAYDKQQKVSRGVFYTPRSVVSYIVRSVDELLCADFGLKDGLADTSTWEEVVRQYRDLRVPDGISPEQPFVQILDPATGTGTFLVEVIEVIHRRMIARWEAEGHQPHEIDALWNEYVPYHLLTRLHGFELLMAPYAIAHLKVGLKLLETGYRFGNSARAQIFLTNALEPAQDFSETLAFAIPALAHEAEAVNTIKRDQRFTVVLGNPPYSSVSSNRIPWSNELIDKFKTTVREEETQIQVLSDDYVRFIARGDFEICRSGVGVLALITNNNFLVGRTFRDLRQAVLTDYDSAMILDLHGNTRLQEMLPDGSRDENVFDIVQGVAITMFSALPVSNSEGCAVYRFDCQGTRDWKYRFLFDRTFGDAGLSEIHPQPPLNRFAESNDSETAEYDAYVSVTALFGTGEFQSDKTHFYGTGFKSQQDGFAIARRKEEIISNVEMLLSPGQTEDNLRERFRLCSTSQWSFSKARDELVRDDWRSLITRCLYRPFDLRWTVFHRGVISNLRFQTMNHLFQPGGLALCTMRGTRTRWQNHVFVSDRMVGKDAVSPLDMCFVFPLSRYYSSDSLLYPEGGRETNLNEKVVRPWLAKLGRGTKEDNGRRSNAEGMLHYVYALLYSPAYQERYNGRLQTDFPRIPLSEDRELFNSLESLGARLVSLHLMRPPSPRPTLGFYSGPKSPEVARVAWVDGTAWLDSPPGRKGQPPRPGSVGFHQIPESVWTFCIGGYQVCHKWLKDRKGRVLSEDDIAHYQKIVVALSGTIRIMGEIDEVIEEHGGWPGAFQTEDGTVQHSS